MSKGFYNEAGMWVAAWEEHQIEVRINATLMALHEGWVIIQSDREFLIEHGYDPDTGEYNG